MAEQNCIIVNISDYTLSPGPRYCSQGESSGEDFYHRVLNSQFKEAVESNTSLLVDLDRVDGYASSFLDEAFGNLVLDFGLNLVKKLVTIKSEEEPSWIGMLNDATYPQWEKRRKAKEDPKVTERHSPWARMHSNGSLETKVWVAV